jgi:hypothetical protein
MPYLVRILPRAERHIASWKLPDEVLVEIYLRLQGKLPMSPSKLLRRKDDGMIYKFSMVDPTNRFCEHFFEFPVLYGQDEETLLVNRGAYVKVVGI